MSIIILSCVNVQTCIAIYLFNILRPRDKFGNTLNAFMIILGIHLTIKLSLLLVLKSDFLYNNNSTGFGVAYGPLLYIITRFHLGKEVRFRMLLLHMLPFALFTLVFLVNSAGYLRGIIAPGFINTCSIVYQLVAAVSLIVYPLVSQRLLNRQTVSGDPTVSHQRKLLISIIRIMLTGMLLGILGITAYYIKTGSWQLNFWILPYVCFGILLLQILRYKIETGIIEQGLLEVPTLVVNEKTTEMLPGKQYRKSALDEEMMDTYEDCLKKFMEKSRIWLEPELSLEDLSERVKIPRHHITQLLNERLKKNFYVFINEYRIAAAVTKLKDPSLDINILSLAYDCGFNSKSSFNNYFKKITGLTPSEYKRTEQHNITITIP